MVNQIKNCIIEKALFLFEKLSIKSVAMGDIATHLCISKRTIYSNFKNKEDLIIACLKEKFEPKKLFNEADNAVVAIIEILQKRLAAAV